MSVALVAGRGGYRLPLLGGLLVLLAGAVAVELMVGAVAIHPARIVALLFGATPDQLESAVLLDIRLPRLVLAIAVGAGLGVSGAAQQGLFRNPLADPALVGVSAGAALAAVAAIVFGGLLLPLWQAPLIPACAFMGGLAATWLALRLAGLAGHGTGGLLLAGIAVNAACGAGTGLLVTISDDRQLRDITFWTMGSLAGGSWAGIAAALAASAAAIALLLPSAAALDALALGERDAAWLGVDIDRLRRRVVTATALAVGAAVAAAGIVGFVGLVVPHLLRLLGSARHGVVLPGAALLGAALLLLADALARSLAAPLELPLGLVTSLIGGPCFILLLIRHGGQR